MSKVKVHTLTPIHIGSGQFLKNNSEFVGYKDSRGLHISVVDPKKILDIIGIEKINDWVSQIERGQDVKSFISNLGNNVSPDKYALRILKNLAGQIGNNDTLKECIHDGIGKAYIPGSSIKGAIRTAVLAALAKDEQGLEGLVMQMSRNGKKNVSARKVEAKLFGEAPNADIFRFVRIGDAYFEYGCELATRMINLNIRQGNNLTDKSKSQLVEAISAECATFTQMKIDNAYYEWAKRHWPNNNIKIKPLAEMPVHLQCLNSLFCLINSHTASLIADDISYWEEVERSGNYGADDYISNLKTILDISQNCKEGKECVLRLGHASGWRFITGAWTENLDNFYDEIVPASRPKEHLYKEYDFPKSRRLDESGEIFGFIKLSLVD